MVKYEKKVGKADYRISKVDKVETDDKGLVRTAWVLMRPRDSREKSLPYRSKKLIPMKVGIQRLVLLCPGEMVEDELGRTDAGDDEQAGAPDGVHANQVDDEEEQELISLYIFRIL